MTARSTVLRGLLGASYYFGGTVIWDLLHRDQAKVLIYHGIPHRTQFEGIENYYGYSIPVEEFERHLIYLKRHCNVVGIGDLITGSNLSRMKTNVVLSFDDGYENHYINAFKLLERYNLPAVFALPTAFVCNRQPLWDDVIEYAVNRCTQASVCIQWEGGEEHEFTIEDFAGRLALYNWLMRQSVQGDQLSRYALIEVAVDALGVSARPEDLFQIEDYRPLTKEHIQKMIRSKLISFASHSVHHYLLAKCDLETKRTELRESRQQIEDLTDLPCNMLCLPGGSYDSGVLDEAFEAGYECVLTSDTGAVENGKRVLNRNGVFREHSMHRFADMVHGPVLEMIEATRRARGTVQTIFN